MKKNEKKLYKSNKNVSDADYDIKKFLITTLPKKI